MTTLEKLIAQRDILDREIDRILSERDEIAPVCEDNNYCRTIYDDEDNYDDENVTIININNIDNSVHYTINNDYSSKSINVDNRSKHTDINTSIAGGDKALRIIGGLLESLF